MRSFISCRNALRLCRPLLLGCLASSAAMGLRAQDSADSAGLIDHWPPRARLEEAGIHPFGTLTGDVWDLAAGGRQTGAHGDTLLDFGVALDTAKLGWWPGGRFLIQGHWLQNEGGPACFSANTGAADPPGNLMAENHLRLFNLCYRQSWADDTVVLKAGQVAVDDDFMLSDYAGLFLNSSLGALPSQVGTRLAACCGDHPAFPLYPVAGPGALLSVKATPKISLQAGVYDGEPGADEANNHGYDWSLHAHTGVGVFYEGEYTYAIGSHAGAFRAGGTGHTGAFDDYAGINAGVAHASADGICSFYAINDFALLADGGGKTVLGGFVRAGVSPQTARSMVMAYGDAGLSWFAPLPGRGQDVAGAAFSWTQFSDDFRHAPDADGLPAAQSALELTYRAQATRWLALQADVQFLFNSVDGAGSTGTATVLGLRAVLTF